MFCSLFNIKKINFFLKKRPTNYNPNSFWIATIQDRSKISSANAIRPFGSFNFSNAIDIDNMLVKNSKINATFLIINE